MAYKMCPYCDKKLRKERVTKGFTGRLGYRTYCSTLGCGYNFRT